MRLNKSYLTIAILVLSAVTIGYCSQFHGKPKPAVAPLPSAQPKPQAQKLPAKKIKKSVKNTTKYTVAIVSASYNYKDFISGFKDGLKKAGYKEGENLNYLYDGPTPPNQIEKKLRDLRKKKIDLLYTTTTPVTKTAQKIFADSDTPIVFAPVFAPIEAGIIDAKTRCGRNITGVMVRGSTAKSLGYLMECLPSLHTIFVPFHNTDLPAKLTLADLKKEADKYGIIVISTDISNQTELYNALENTPSASDAIWMTHSSLIVANAPSIIEAATKLNLPVVSPAAQYRNGALLSYAPSPKDMGQQASKIADKILRGMPASNIPVEPPEYFLGFNLKTANILGIEVRDDILQEADFIIR